MAKAKTKAKKKSKPIEDLLHIPKFLKAGTKENKKWRDKIKKSRQKRLESFHKKITTISTKNEVKPILGIPTEDEYINNVVEVKRPLGPIDTVKTKKEVDKYGFKIGTKVSQAAILYARKQGASLGEIKDAIGSPQRNLLTVVDKLPEFKVVKESKKDSSGKEIVRYYIKAK